MISQKRIEKWKPIIEDYLALAAVTPTLRVTTYAKSRGIQPGCLYEVARAMGYELAQYNFVADLDTEAIRSPSQMGYLEGHILGDACVHKSAQRKREHCVVHWSSHKDYHEWITSTVVAFKGRPIWDRISKDSRTAKTYSTFYVRSLAHPVFSELREVWYPGGKKCVPRNLVLRPETLLTWFLDDGSKATHGGMYLATDGFTLDEVETLCELMTATFGFKASPHRNDGHYRIYIPARDRSAFTDVIGPCPVQCFSYKW